MLISQLLETRTTGSQNSRSCQTAVSGQDGKCSLRTGEEKISWWFFKKKKLLFIWLQVSVASCWGSRAGSRAHGLSSYGLRA